MWRASGVVSLLTDFGAVDPYVGIMKGMLVREHRTAQIVDLCHDVPAHDVGIGAFFLRAAVGRFPPGTVHVGVVDPGVGSARRIVAARAHECVWLAPDNGLLGPLLADAPRPEVRLVDAAALGLGPASMTFHGRDVFAPVAGRLSSGRYGFSALGPRIEDAAVAPADAEPRVLLVDRFGNLVTTLPAEVLFGRDEVEVAGRRIPVRPTYAGVERGELVALVNSYGLVEIAAREARADELLGIGRGAPMQIGGSDA